MSYNVCLVFKENFQDAKKVWDCISPLMVSEKVDIFDFKKNHLTKNKVRMLITSDFNVEFDGYEIDFTYIANSKINILIIKNIEIGFNELESILMPLFKSSYFLQGRVYDEDYDIWQNMDDVSYYEINGRNHSMLPKKSNRLPYPLERTIIDTSSNPGRYIFRNGYIEFIGSVMWFSKELLDLLQSDIKGLKEHSFIGLEDCNSYIKIIAHDQLFFENDGSENKQFILRKLIYPAF